MMSNGRTARFIAFVDKVHMDHKEDGPEFKVVLKQATLLGEPLVALGGLRGG